MLCNGLCSLLVVVVRASDRLIFELIFREEVQFHHHSPRHSHCMFFHYCDSCNSGRISNEEDGILTNSINIKSYSRRKFVFLINKTLDLLLLLLKYLVFLFKFDLDALQLCFELSLLAF